MAGDDGGGKGEERERGEGEGPPVYVLSLPAAAPALPLPVAVSCLDAAVPRKARRRRLLPRAKPSGWWSFRLLVPPKEEEKNPPSEEVKLPAPRPAGATNLGEEARPPRPKRVRVRVRLAPPPDSDTPARATKRARRCLQCGSAETPQWRSGPMGRGTLCNACGVRLKAAGALREQERRPPRATARTVAEPPQPESPVSDSPPNSPIWEPGSVPDVYLVRRKPSKRGRPPPPSTESAPAPAVYLIKKKKPPKRKPWRPGKSAKRCLHCGSSSTPQWREGPMGRSTLCNACGVRYRQGRLLPEYRPLASPTFVPSEHANKHRQVLQLRRQRQDCRTHRPPPPEQPRPMDVGGNGDDPMDVLEPRRRWHGKNEYPPTPVHQPLPQPVGSLASDLRLSGIDDSAGAAAGCGGGGGNDLIDAPSSLDSLLLDGPSAPLIVDGDEPLVD